MDLDKDAVYGRMAVVDTTNWKPGVVAAVDFGKREESAMKDKRWQRLHELEDEARSITEMLQNAAAFHPESTDEHEEAVQAYLARLLWKVEKLEAGIRMEMEEL